MNTDLVIPHDPGTYLVQSSRVPDTYYLVDLSGRHAQCDCQWGRRCEGYPCECRHVRLARLFASTHSEETEEGV